MRSAPDPPPPSEDGAEPDLERMMTDSMPALLAFVRARAGRELRAREMTIDLVQSACREVLEDLDGRKLPPASRFRHWLFLAAERKIRDRGRYHKRQKRESARARPFELSEDEEVECYRRGVSRFFSPSREAAAREQLEALQHALTELPEEYREVILLARVVGLGYAELSEHFERSEGAVRKLLHRALARLALDPNLAESAVLGGETVS